MPFFDEQKHYDTIKKLSKPFREELEKDARIAETVRDHEHEIRKLVEMLGYMETNPENYSDYAHGKTHRMCLRLLNRILEKI